MTDDEVTRILAKRSGTSEGYAYNYLTDRNALRHAIENMTQGERGILCRQLWDIFNLNDTEDFEYAWLLTCDPRIIAEACAAAIREGGGA